MRRFGPFLCASLICVGVFAQASAAGFNFVDASAESGIDYKNVCGAEVGSKGWLAEGWFARGNSTGLSSGSFQSVPRAGSSSGALSWGPRLAGSVTGSCGGQRPPVPRPNGDSVGPAPTSCGHGIGRRLPVAVGFGRVRAEGAQSSDASESVSS